jgi:hypothetical protein
MIDKITFASCIQEMALLLGVEASNEYLKAMYKHISGYFNNDDFKVACHNILTQDDLYGKLPTVKHFMKYTNVVNKNDIRTQKKNQFLNKVCSYLQLDYVSRWDKEEFYKDMTELESRTLQSAGGISEMYQRVHNLDYPTNIATIRKELSSFYDDNYTSENVVKCISSRNGMNSLGGLLNNLLLKGVKDESIT